MDVNVLLLLMVLCKQSFVKSKLPVIKEFSDAKLGMITVAFITAVKEHGCFVKFCNNISGLIPASNLSGSLEELKNRLQIGKVGVSYVVTNLQIKF